MAKLQPSFSSSRNSTTDFIFQCPGRGKPASWASMLRCGRFIALLMGRLLQIAGKGPHPTFGVTEMVVGIGAMRDVPGGGNIS